MTGRLLALVLLAGAAVVPAAAPAGAATPTHVAIVIAGKGTACVRAGGTGDAILNAVATVGYRPSDHLIVQIDGTPNPPRADSTHYWSYWHDTGGGWTYSQVGASSYTPAPGTVEGWAYDDGQANASPPPSVSYSAICGAADSPPPPPPSSSPRPTPHPSTTARSPGGGTTPPPTTTSHGLAGDARTRTTSVRAAGHPGSASASRSAGGRSSSAGREISVPTSASASSSPAAAALPTLHRPAAQRADAGSPVPLLVAFVLTLLLGGAAGGAVWWRRRLTP